MEVLAELGVLAEQNVELKHIAIYCPFSTNHSL